MSGSSPLARFAFCAGPNEGTDSAWVGRRVTAPAALCYEDVE